MSHVSVQTEDFDPQAVVETLRAGRADIGAVVTFVGLVRDITPKEGQDTLPPVSAMELEHYPGMTEKALQDIVDEAYSRWALQGVRLIHRVGTLLPADQIVLIAVASPHRGDAFAACEFMIDYLKTRAPFWKKEFSKNGGHWVDARESDERVMARWTKTG